MTPKEKAEELFYKYDNLLNPDTETYICIEAKYCAIVAVDLVLYAINEDAAYWEKVKEEINKL